MSATLIPFRVPTYAAPLCRWRSVGLGLPGQPWDYTESTHPAAADDDDEPVRMYAEAELLRAGLTIRKQPADVMFAL